MFGSIVILTLLIIAISVWAVHRSTAPLALFAKASERLGRDVNAPPLPEDGPREVRRASRAFNEMQRRLRAYLDDRMQMLAAISHDLRTPITRMRLRAEFIADEEQQKKMLADLDQMEQMITATLAFARDEASAEPSILFDLAAMLESLIDDDCAAGANASYHGPETLIFTGRPIALKRAFQNLIDNAVKYGGRAAVTLAEDKGQGRLVISVADDGPGIPEAEQKNVFAPFYRVERSRSRDTGGVGLGLAVVRSVVGAHGGEVTFAAVDGGGFRVMVSLPGG
ncbi:MAG: HAMP domain-containing protein [Rhodospirillaceae bacterium]|nr:HAMP domain-containing protein [Rhodospirillaceae bacterium]